MVIEQMDSNLMVRSSSPPNSSPSLRDSSLVLTSDLDLDPGGVKFIKPDDGFQLSLNHQSQLA